MSHNFETASTVQARQKFLLHSQKTPESAVSLETHQLTHAAAHTMDTLIASWCTHTSC